MNKKQNKLGVKVASRKRKEDVKTNIRAKGSKEDRAKELVLNIHENILTPTKEFLRRLRHRNLFSVSLPALCHLLRVAIEVNNKEIFDILAPFVWTKDRNKVDLYKQKDLWSNEEPRNGLRATYIEFAQKGTVTPSLIYALINNGVGFLQPVLRSCRNNQGSKANDIETKNGDSIAHIAAKYGTVEVVSTLLRNNINFARVNKEEVSPLRTAIRYNNITVARFLIKKGISINEINDYGIKINPIITEALMTKDTKLIKDIINAECDLNEPTRKGGNVLHHVCELPSELTTVWAREFVKMGVDVNRTDEDGDTPISQAIVYDDCALLEFLIESGATLQTRKTPYLHQIVFCRAIKCLWHLVMETRIDPEERLDGKCAFELAYDLDLETYLNILIELAPKVLREKDPGYFLQPNKKCRFMILKHLILLDKRGDLTRGKLENFINHTSDIPLREHYYKCLSEFDRIDSISLLDELTVGRLLLCNKDELYNHWNSKTVRNKVKEQVDNEIKNDECLFNKILEHRQSLADARKEMFDEKLELFKEIFPRFDHYIVQKIVDYALEYDYTTRFR